VHGVAQEEVGPLGAREAQHLGAAGIVRPRLFSKQSHSNRSGNGCATWSAMPCSTVQPDSWPAAAAAATSDDLPTPTQRTMNRALPAARAPVERDVARLKSRRMFRRARCGPNRLSSIAAAVLTLERQR
jgi:hypothetical protein